MLIMKTHFVFLQDKTLKHTVLDIKYMNNLFFFTAIALTLFNTPSIMSASKRCWVRFYHQLLVGVLDYQLVEHDILILLVYLTLSYFSIGARIDHPVSLLHVRIV